MAQTYSYPKLTNGALLEQQIAGAGIAGANVSIDPAAGATLVAVPTALNAPQKTTLDGLITAHNASQKTAVQQAQVDAAAAAAAAEGQDATDRATLDAFDTGMANYIALATPTAAQTAAAVQAQAKAWRYVVRRLRRTGVL